MHVLLDPLVNGTVSILEWGGVFAIFLLMVVESACIPVPSEAIMLWAGYLVWQGDARLIEVIAAGVLGNLVGSIACWFAGSRGGRPFIDRHGRWIRLNHHHIEIAERWFERWGAPTVFFTRNLPIVRTFISLPAGIAEMPLGRFAAYTFFGCIPWVTGLALIGRSLGPRWQDIKDNQLHDLDLAVAGLIVVGILVLLVRGRRRRRALAADAALPVESPAPR